MSGLDIHQLRTAVAAIEALEKLDERLKELNVGEWWVGGELALVCCDEHYGRIVNADGFWEYHPAVTP